MNETRAAPTRLPAISPDEFDPDSRQDNA